MSTPPNVWLRLRPAFWRIFPCLLTAEWRQVEEGPKIAQGFVATPRCKVGAKDSVAVSQKDARTGGFVLRSRYTEIHVEVALRRGDPRQVPAHSFLVRKDVR